MKRDLFSLEGSTILVTGASSGIGRRTARLIAERGGQVVAAGRREDRLRECVDSLEGSGHIAVTGDLVKEPDRKHLVAQCPPLHGIVHNAGIARIAPIRYTTEKVLRETYSINVEAPILLTQELVKARQPADGGSIVFVSSISGSFGWPGYVAYGSSKAALQGVCRGLAADLAPQKIRCNAVAPARVWTRMLAAGPSAEELAKDEASYPLGFGQPIDVAAAIVFLLSDASRWITGQCLVMDGGVTLQ